MSEEFVDNLNKSKLDNMLTELRRKPLEEKLTKTIEVFENVVNMIIQNETVRSETIKQIQHKIMHLEGKIRNIEAKLDNQTNPIPPPPPPLQFPKKEISPMEGRAIMMKELEDMFKKQKKEK